MNNIDTRSPFFPNQAKVNQSNVDKLKRNSSERAVQLQKQSAPHAKVNIKDQIKDFSKIKMLADNPVEVDNSKKIADLKERIKQGNYNVDYEALADKMLMSEY